MADTERNEDQKISRCLQEAFGYTDEQLLKQLDQANETLKDVNFNGAEDRIMQKFMARKAEVEKEKSIPMSETTVQEKPVENGDAEETAKEVTLVKTQTEKKIVRFGKKKILATAALVAVIAVMLGGTAIGKRNYFLRKSDVLTEVILDNAKNKTSDLNLEEVYGEIKNTLHIPVLKLGYYPDEMTFKDYEVYTNSIKIRFLYKNNIVYMVQAQKEKSGSMMIESDRAEKKEVYNKWLDKKIEYTINKLSDGSEECGVVLTKDNNYYYIFGNIQEDEFKKILGYLNFL